METADSIVSETICCSVDVDCSDVVTQCKAQYN